ncbi:hypothetical protein [Flaviaesturariibacter amylovorans]
MSLRKEFLLVIKAGAKTHKLPVRELAAQGRLAEAERFLSERLGTYVWA